MCIVASSNVFTLGLQKGLMTDQEKKGDKKKVTEELKNNQSIKMSGR